LFRGENVRNIEKNGHKRITAQRIESRRESGGSSSGLGRTKESLRPERPKNNAPAKREEGDLSELSG